jgi:hypothetical protein
MHRIIPSKKDTAPAIRKNVHGIVRASELSLFLRVNLGSSGKSSGKIEHTAFGIHALHRHRYTRFLYNIFRSFTISEEE